MDWFIERNHASCTDEQPWAVVKADDGTVEGCHATREDANGQLLELLQTQAEQREQQVDEAVDDGRLPADDTQAVTAAVADDMAANPEMKLVTGVAVTEGVWTGDGRNFAEDSLTWENLDEVIAHLQWQKESSHGGINDVTVSVGRITKLTRAGNNIEVEAYVDTGSEDGAEAFRRLKNGTLGGVSIVADDPEQADVEVVYPEGCAELQEKSPDELDDIPVEDLERCMWPSGVIFHSGRIRALTLVDIPAFVTGTVELADTDDEIAEDGEITVESTTASGRLDPATAGSVAGLIDQLEPLLAAAHVITVEDAPPAEWFEEPEQLPPFGAITVTDAGRVYGLVAPRDVAHRSFHDRRVTVPTGNVDYSRWMNRETIVAGGERIATGVITMDCGHASTDTSMDAQASLDHYDNSCSVVASVRIGENQHGTWIAGSLLPGVTAYQVTRMLACALSGDWRPHRDKPGMREFVAALLVPVPGFPTESKANLRVDQGQLVASTVPVRRATTSSDCTTCGDDAETLTAAVIGATDLPVADRDTEWDGDAARDRVFDMCSDGDTVDVDCVSRAFLWRDPDQDAENRGAYSLGFADVIDGRLQIVPRGVAATAGGRGVGAADIPEDDKDQIRSRICTLYDRIRDEFDDWPACPFDDDTASTDTTESESADAEAEAASTDTSTGEGVFAGLDLPSWEDVQQRRALKTQTDEIAERLFRELGIEIEV